mgnify:CR=1 FL=1
MKVLITGAEGFIGSHLTELLVRDGHNVRAFVLYNSFNSWGWLEDCAAEVRDQVEVFLGDVRDPHGVHSAVRNCDAVIHLAALSTDPLCKGKAYQCFDTNVMGTLNLMNVAMKKNVTQFIFASSEWVYSGFTGNEEKNEEATIDITKISSEYALSKLVSEANLRQQYTLGFCDVTILRFGIIYGHKNGKGSAVESIARTVKNCESITTKSLKTGRRFVHVKDIARGIILSLGLKNFNIINLSGNKVNTLKEIIETSQRIFHKKIEIIEDDPDNPDVRNPSNRKASKIINWKPEIDLERGIKDLESFL